MAAKFVDPEEFLQPVQQFKFNREKSFVWILTNAASWWNAVSLNIAICKKLTYHTRRRWQEERSTLWHASSCWVSNTYFRINKLVQVKCRQATPNEPVINAVGVPNEHYSRVKVCSEHLLRTPLADSGRSQTVGVGLELCARSLSGDRPAFGLAEKAHLAQWE